MIFTQILVSYALALVIGFFLIPQLKKLKLKQTERLDGPKSHLKKNGTPTMGGLIFIFAILVSLAIFSIYFGIKDQTNLFKPVVPVILTSLGFGLIGFLDDLKKALTKKGISAKTKMLGLFIIALAYLLYLVYYKNIQLKMLIPFTKQSIFVNEYVYIIINLLALLGTTNAINLTDGIDGLATLVSLPIIIALTIISQKLFPDLQYLPLLVIGALTGYLTYNLHPAKVFMGDTGSLFIGGFIASYAISLNCPLILLIICFVPIIETLSVMMQVTYFKLTKGKRIFKMTPIHHHFELSGLSENLIVILFTLVSIIFSYIGLVSLGIKIF